MEWEIENLSETENPFLYYTTISSTQDMDTCTDPTIATETIKTLVQEDESLLLKNESLLQEDESHTTSMATKDTTLTESTVDDIARESQSVQDKGQTLERERFDIYQLPFLIKTWIYSASSILMFSLALYIVITLFISVKNDLHLKSDEMYLDLMQEIQECTSNYQANACHLDLPAIKDLCMEWKSCMAKPLEVKKLKITVAYIVEIMNWLFDSVSFRTIGLMLLVGIFFSFKF